LENILHEAKTAFGALAHRMFARVWHGSMMRAGKFSWWILSILLGPQRRDEWLKASSLKRRAREWDDYQKQQPQPVVSSSKNNNNSGNTIGHSLSLWAKFSVTLAVAVALAIRHGPGSLLSDDTPANEHDDNNNNNRNIKTHPEDASPPIQDPAATITRPVLWTRPLTIEDFLTG
jgi:hypothetical protein